MYEVMVKTDFSAAHYLEEYGGKCEELHGHNFEVLIFLQGENLDEKGLLLDFREVKKKAKKILDEVDHKNLNDLGIFKDKNPSSENIAKHIFEKLTKGFSSKGLKLSRVEVWETPRQGAAYFK